MTMGEATREDFGAAESWRGRALARPLGPPLGTPRAAIPGAGEARCPDRRSG